MRAIWPNPQALFYKCFIQKDFNISSGAYSLVKAEFIVS